MATGSRSASAGMPCRRWRRDVSDRAGAGDLGRDIGVDIELAATANRSSSVGAIGLEPMTCWL
jgi:hypothetical protein